MFSDYFNKLTENRHYFVQFFHRGGACLQHKIGCILSCNYSIVASKPLKLTASDVAELFANVDLLVSTDHQWQLHSVSANMQCSCPVQNLTQKTM